MTEPSDVLAELDRTRADLATERAAREKAESEVERLRAGIRKHRDASGHDLCWYHPELWDLLPDKVDPDRETPPWPEFMRRCAEYRRSLDDQDAVQDDPLTTARATIEAWRALLERASKWIGSLAETDDAPDEVLELDRDIDAALAAEKEKA